MISRFTGSGSVSGAISGSFNSTIIVPSGRTSTPSAPACFAARMARAISACVNVAARRGIGSIDLVGNRDCHSRDDGCGRPETERPKRTPRHAVVELPGRPDRAVPSEVLNLRAFPGNAALAQNCTSQGRFEFSMLSDRLAPRLLSRRRAAADPMLPCLTAKRAKRRHSDPAGDRRADRGTNTPSRAAEPGQMDRQERRDCARR